MSTVHPLEPGDPVAVGGYALSGRLGSGGQAVVYLGRSSHGQEVAVKVFNDAWLADPEARDRAAQEAAALLDVARYATTPLVAADLQAHPPYLVSEYVPGASLQEAVRRDGPLPAGAVERLAANTLTALMAVHQAGIVHRDLKPANIVLGPDGPRLVDFGISGYRGARENSPDGVLGTPAFMSPEQVRGEPAAPSSDMFSWAATMAFAASGGSPFAGGTPAEVVRRVEHGVPDLAGVPDPLAGLLTRCLAKDPGARPTARDALGLLVAAVDRASDRSPAPVPAWGTPTPPADLPTPPRTPEPEPARAPEPAARPGPPRRTVLVVVAASFAGALLVQKVATAARPGGGRPLVGPVQPVPPPSGAASPGAGGLRVAEPYENYLSHPWFSPDGRHTAWLDFDGFLHLVSVTSGQEEQVLPVSASGAGDRHLSQDGTMLVEEARGSLSVLTVTEVATGRVLAEFDQEAHVSGAVFTPDGRHLLVATFEGGNRVWRLPEGAPVGRQINGRFASQVISPDGRYVVTWSVGDSVPLWDVATGEIVHRLAGEMLGLGETAAAFSPDNTLVAVGSGSERPGLVSLYQVSDGASVAALSEPAPAPEDDLATDAVTSVVFSPDSSRLAAATRAGTVRVWDVASGDRVGPVRTAERYTLDSLRFSPDGRLVAARHLDHTVTVWPVAD